MERERILAILREHESELKAAGLLHLRLFGSIARGDNTPDSDVDLLFDYDESKTGNVLTALGSQDRVTEIVGAPVHLTSTKHLKTRLRNQVLQEAVVAY